MSSRLTFNIRIDTPTIEISNLTDEQLESIREVTRLDGVVEWHSQGMAAVLSNGLLRDVLEAYDYWKAAPKRYQVDKPSGVGVFYWGDATPVSAMRPEL